MHRGCRPIAEVWDEQERKGCCGEGTLLAEDDQRGSTERDADSSLLSPAAVAGESVLLVAAQAKGQSAGWDNPQSGRP